MKNVTSQKISVIGTLTLLVSIGDSIVGVAFGAVRNLAVPVFIEPSLIDRFVNGIFRLKWKIVPYNFKYLPIFDIRNLLEEPKDKYRAQDVMSTEEDDRRLLRMAMQIEIHSRSEGIMLVVTDAKRLVQIVPILE